jgi:hypothetical protein
MTWRLQTQLICVEHCELLVMNDQAPVPMVLAPEIGQMQVEVLSRLRPTIDNAAFFVDLEGHLRRANSRGWEPLHLRASVTPERALTDLAAAVQMALGRGYPDAQGLTNWPVQARNRHIRAPQPLGFTGDWNVFPHLLPTPTFVGRLSDALFPAPIRDGRAIAALGTLLSATGCDLYTAIELLPPRRRMSHLGKFVQQLVRIEQQGRAEDFWRQCREAVRTVLEEDIDYRAREAVCFDRSAFLASVAAEPGAHEGMVRTWLVDQWACTFTTSRVRPSILDRTIEQFDVRYGPAMLAALERLQMERAA